MTPDRVAQCAQLAMLFELSSSPKPGNIDRCHDFFDIKFHHFLISAVSAYPVFRKAAQGEGTIGSLILEGVKAWKEWNIDSNTHFGTLVLMIPIALVASRPGNLREELASALRTTTVQDAIDFSYAFEMAGARVVEVKEFSLKDPTLAMNLCKESKTLLDLMKLSQGHDLIALEWSNSYERSFRFAERISELTAKHGLNEGIVRTYLEALAQTPDTLIQAKFGAETAMQVSILASIALRDQSLESAKQLDDKLLREDINPGSTADLIAASLFISLLMDLRD